MSSLAPRRAHDLRASLEAILVVFAPVVVTLGVVVLAVVTLPTIAYAQDPATLRFEQTIETPSSIALGSGARAASIGTAAALNNPAALHRRKLYHIEGVAGVAIEPGLWSSSVVIADSITNIVAAGVAIEAVYGSKPTTYSGWDIRLALALPIGELVSIGLTGRYLRYTANDETMGEPGVKGFTFDAAVRVEPIQGLVFAALGYNLLDRESDLVPRLLGGSVGFDLVPNLLVGADVLVDISTFDRVSFVLGGGASYRIAEILPIRAGYRHDTRRGLGQITAGIGYEEPRFAFDFALRRDLIGGSVTQLMLSARYHVQ